MPTIEIHDIEPAGHSLFDDSESYLTELSSDEGFMIQGGATTVTGSAVSSVQCASISVMSSPYCLTATLLLAGSILIYINRNNNFGGGLPQHK